MNLGFNSRELLQRANEKFPGGSATLSFLRQQVELKNNQTTLLFDFDGNQPGVSTERKLSSKDGFFAHSLGLYLLIEDSAKPGSGVLQSYPNYQTIIRKAGILVANASDLEALYNGQMKAQIDQTVVFDGLDTRRFRH